MARKKKVAATIKMPETWKADFASATMRTNFMLTLTQPMIEFLSAVADDVAWDRREFISIHRPDNWIATENALEKRGLIRRKCQAESDAHMERTRKNEVEDSGAWNFCELTPAGEAVVQLLKVTGIFVESDAAIRKKARKA